MTCRCHCYAIAIQVLRSAELDLKKLTNRLKQFTEDRRKAKHAVDKMLSQYPWIVEEKAFFGRPQTDYDFEARDPKVAQAHLKSLREEQASLSKKVTVTTTMCVCAVSCLEEYVVLFQVEI